MQEGGGMVIYNCPGREERTRQILFSGGGEKKRILTKREKMEVRDFPLNPPSPREKREEVTIVKVAP